MNRALFCFVVAFSASYAFGDPFANLTAHGHASVTTHTKTAVDEGGSSYSSDIYDNYSISVGYDLYSNLNDQWDYYYDVFDGYDDQGNPIYHTESETQYETAQASAQGFGQFERTETSLMAGVYAFHTSYASAQGSQAFAEAFASSNASVHVDFSLLKATHVNISTETAFGNAYVGLYRDGNLIVNTGSTSTTPTAFLLAAGNYTIESVADGGRADMKIEIEAVPEPASMAALGLGILALAHRRRRS